MAFCGHRLRTVTGRWYPDDLYPLTSGGFVTARNFKGQFSSWPATAFFIFCGALLLAMIND